MKNIILVIIGSFLVSCATVPGDSDFIPENRHQAIKHIIKIAPDWFKKQLTSESAISSIKRSKSPRESFDSF